MANDARRPQSPRAVEAPRLPAALTPDDGTDLVDDTDWTAVERADHIGGPAHVTGVDLTACRVSGVRLTERSFDRVRLVDVLVEDCELAGTVLERTTFARVEFRRCRMSGLVAPGLVASDVRLVSCKMDGASFRMSSWDRLTMDDCDLQDTDFFEASMVSGEARAFGVWSSVPTS